MCNRGFTNAAISPGSKSATQFKDTFLAFAIAWARSSIVYTCATMRLSPCTFSHFEIASSFSTGSQPPRGQTSATVSLRILHVTRTIESRRKKKKEKKKKTLLLGGPIYGVLYRLQLSRWLISRNAECVIMHTQRTTKRRRYLACALGFILAACYAKWWVALYRAPVYQPQAIGLISRYTGAWRNLTWVRRIMNIPIDISFHPVCILKPRIAERAYITFRRTNYLEILRKKH